MSIDNEQLPVLFTDNAPGLTITGEESVLIVSAFIAETNPAYATALQNRTIKDSKGVPSLHIRSYLGTGVMLDWLVARDDTIPGVTDPNQLEAIERLRPGAQDARDLIKKLP